MYTELFTMYNFYKKSGLCHWLQSILSDLEKTTNILHLPIRHIGSAHTASKASRCGARALALLSTNVPFFAIESTITKDFSVFRLFYSFTSFLNDLTEFVSCKF